VTLSSDSGAAATPAAHGTLVRVVFADSVALSDVERLLRATEARVVDGPTERGVYTVELKGANELSADRLRALRGSELVRFAEPVMVGASGAQ
jgi:fervidolysin-like protein